MSDEDAEDDERILDQFRTCSRRRGKKRAQRIQKRIREPRMRPPALPRCRGSAWSALLKNSPRCGNETKLQTRSARGLEETSWARR